MTDEYVLVPKEPTEEMLQAVRQSPFPMHVKDFWTAMLAARPTPPVDEFDTDSITALRLANAFMDTAVQSLGSENDTLKARIAELESKISRIKTLISQNNEEICQTLGKVLGYPWFKDDQKNFSGATEADGVCVGPNVAATLADQAARRIAELEANLQEAVDLLKRIADQEHKETDRISEKRNEYPDHRYPNWLDETAKRICATLAPKGQNDE